MSPQVLYGQNRIMSLVSRSHGRQVPQYIESLEIDVALTNKKLYFYGTKGSLALSIYESVSGRFGYLETEEKVVMSTLMDISPSSAVLNDDPSAYVEYHIFTNDKNEAGKVIQGTFIKGCRVTGAPESMAPREEQHVQTSFIGGIRYKVKGGGIQYVRFVGSTTAYATADDVQMSGTGPHSGTLPVSATATNIEDNVTTRPYLAVYRNGEDVSKVAAYTGSGAGFSITGTAVVFPSGTFSATDVWEIYTAYTPV